MNPAESSEPGEGLFVGIDVGGTNVKIGLIDDSGKILGNTAFPTEQEKGPEFALAKACEMVQGLLVDAGLDYSRVLSFGLGTPGPMDIPAGLILTPANLPGWRNFPVRETLARLSQRPVTFANDAAAAAFGEYWVGSGKAYSSIVLVTLGTGVGGGIIVDDVSIDGAHSHGAEIGHMVIDSRDDARVCSCGMKGHLEAYASATAVVARTLDRLLEGAASELTEDLSLTPLMVAKAATNGDELARQIVMETADYLAAGLSSLAHVIDPGAILIGGAMNFGGSQDALGSEFLERVRARVRSHTFPMVAKNLTIEFASLGSGAGFVGAAGLGRRDFLRSHRHSAVASQRS